MGSAGGAAIHNGLCAHAAELPGVAIPFDVGPAGQWTLPAELPAHLAQAGVQPGWGLTAIDGVKFTSELAAQQQVGRGPARPVQLHFATPEGETVLVVNRGPLIQLEEVGLLPWPEGFAAARHSWVLGEDGCRMQDELALERRRSRRKAVGLHGERARDLGEQRATERRGRCSRRRPR